jgi:branched-chain amino acid transport system ATP-binding protein
LEKKTLKMLEVSDLHAGYGNIETLHGISFHVDRGEIVALLGANGAGKSTTLMSIMRVAPPDGPVVRKGEIRFNGTNLLPLPAHLLVSRYGIGLVPEGRHIFGNLTVFENLKLAAFARKDHGQIQRDFERVFALFPRLADRKSQRGDLLSGGEQQMLAVGRAFMSGAGFVLLDEPSMGLSPLLMVELFRVLKELNGSGTTFLVVEQNARIALKYAHRAYILEAGKIVLEGPSQALSQNPEIRRAYLG